MHIRSGCSDHGANESQVRAQARSRLRDDLLRHRVTHDRICKGIFITSFQRIRARLREGLDLAMALHHLGGACGHCGFFNVVHQQGYDDFWQLTSILFVCASARAYKKEPDSLRARDFVCECLHARVLELVFVCVFFCMCA